MLSNRLPEFKINSGMLDVADTLLRPSRDIVRTVSTYARISVGADTRIRTRRSRPAPARLPVRCRLSLSFSRSGAAYPRCLTA